MGVLHDYLGFQMRLMLVDPDTEIHDELTRAANATNGDCAVLIDTADERDVLDLLSRYTVDCVLLADNLTFRPWPQVTQQILAAHPAMRVALFTEHPSAQLDAECQRYGIRRMIRKHLDAPQLVHQFEQMFEDERRRRADVEDAAPVRPGGGLAAIRSRVPCRVVVFCSGYAGGAGKTTALVNMAIRLANHPVNPQRVAVVDLEKGRGSLRVLFSLLLPPRPSILDFAGWAGAPEIPVDTLRGMIPEDTLPARKYHLSCIYGPYHFERSDEVSPELVGTVLATLRQHYDFVLVDLPADVTDAAIAAMRAASTVLWCIRVDVKDIERHKDIVALLRRADNIDLAKFRALITLLPSGLKPRFSPEQIHQALGFPLLPWALPYDARIAMAGSDEFAATTYPTGDYMASLNRVLGTLWPEMATDRIEHHSNGATTQRRRGLAARLFGR